MKQRTIEILEALSHRMRVRVAEEIGRRPLSTQDLAQRIGIGAAAVAHHLQTLRSAGLVRSSTGRRPVLHELHKENFRAAIDDVSDSTALDEPSRLAADPSARSSEVRTTARPRTGKRAKAKSAKSPGRKPIRRRG